MVTFIFNHHYHDHRHSHCNHHDHRHHLIGSIDAPVEDSCSNIACCVRTWELTHNFNLLYILNVEVKQVRCDSIMVINNHHGSQNIQHLNFLVGKKSPQHPRCNLRVVWQQLRDPPRQTQSHTLAFCLPCCLKYWKINLWTIYINHGRSTTRGGHFESPTKTWIRGSR